MPDGRGGVYCHSGLVIRPRSNFPAIGVVVQGMDTASDHRSRTGLKQVERVLHRTAAEVTVSGDFNDRVRRRLLAEVGRARWPSGCRGGGRESLRREGLESSG